MIAIILMFEIINKRTLKSNDVLTYSTHAVSMEGSLID